LAGGILKIDREKNPVILIVTHALKKLYVINMKIRFGFLRICRHILPRVEILDYLTFR